MRFALYSLVLLAACRGETTLDRSDKHLAFGAGIWLLDGKPFTGTLVENLPDVERRTHCVLGREDGAQTARTHTGVLVEERYYRAGKKHGVQRGYFADGRDRFYSEFDDDRYVGEYWTWHANGQVAEFKKYTKDGQILVHKHWRESGQIYRNQVFEVKGNREAGMPGVKLCNTVKDTVAAR